MIYDKYEGNSALVHIENININDPYCSIGSKAFLSCKNVCEIKLPETITEIGDWAFAHMKDLEKIIVPANEIHIGRDAFLDCENLKEIAVYPDESENKGLSYLLASCISIIKCYELLDFKKASVNNKAWCEQYDEKIIHYINSPDEKNFKFYIVGWFDDDSEEEQLEQHIRSVKFQKLLLSFIRLKYDTNISEQVKDNIVSYIKRRFYESKNGEDSAWEIFRDKLSDDLAYVKVATGNNLISEERKLELIKYINRRNGNPEIVAYLLSLGEKKETIEQLFEL